MLMERKLWLDKILGFFEGTTYNASFVPDAYSVYGAEGRACADSQCLCLLLSWEWRWARLPARTVLTALPLTCWHVRACTPVLGWCWAECPGHGATPWVPVAWVPQGVVQRCALEHVSLM